MKSETPQPAAAQSLLQQAAKEWLERYPYYDTTGAGESYIAFSRAWPIIAGIASQSEVQPPAAATQETGTRYFTSVNGFLDTTLYVRVDSEGHRFAMDRDGHEWLYTAAKLERWLELVQEGEWRELTADEAKSLAEVIQPAAATQEREALREMTSALKGFVEWHGGAHVGPCPEDDTCDCPGKPYNDAVNEVIRKADAILKVQPAAAAPQDETLALVNQALTKAGSRHIVGTKDGVIVACTIEEALQPAAAAPPIDLLELEQLIEEKRGRCRYWNVSVQGYSELQDLIREGEFLERLLARLRALQGSDTA